MQGSVLRTTYSDVKNQRSIPRMHDGAEEVGNLNSSVHRDSRNLNVQLCWRVNTLKPHGCISTM